MCRGRGREGHRGGAHGKAVHGGRESAPPHCSLTCVAAMCHPHALTHLSMHSGVLMDKLRISAGTTRWADPPAATRTSGGHVAGGVRAELTLVQWA